MSPIVSSIEVEKNLAIDLRQNQLGIPFPDVARSSWKLTLPLPNMSLIMVALVITRAHD